MRMQRCNCILPQICQSDVFSIVRHSNNFVVYLSLRAIYSVQVWKYLTAAIHRSIQLCACRDEIAYCCTYGGECVSEHTLKDHSIAYLLLHCVILVAPGSCNP